MSIKKSNKKIVKKVNTVKVSTPKVKKVKEEVNVISKIAKSENSYQLTVILNDQVFDFETDNLAESILSCTPEFLKTKLVLQFSRGGKKVERVFSLFDGRRLFHNRYFLENLINNLSI